MSPLRRRLALASCLSLCLIVLAATPVQALDPREALTQFGLDVWQRRQGLPQSTVTAIAQTEDGYIWLGTQEGLVRFDGVRFTVFDRKNTPVLTRHHITCLLASRDGGLWIGVLGGGLVRYENGRFQGAAARPALPEEIVSALMEDRDGQLWIGTFSKGIVRLRLGSLSPLTTSDGLSNNEVRALYQDRDGAVWIGTRGGGVNRYDNGHFTVWTTKEGLSNDQVTAIRGDASGGIWIATRGGVNRMADGRITVFGSRDGLVSDVAIALAPDRDGNMWVGTVAGGLHRFSGGRFTSMSKKDGLSSDLVQALLEDRDGSLWIGASGGLNRLRPGRFLVTSAAEGLSDDDVRPVLEDRTGALWIGTLGGGLNRIRDGQLAVFRTKDGLLSDRVWALHEDPAGALWVGTREGLNRYEKGRWTGYTKKDGLSNDLVLAVASDAEGSLWIGTAGGLDRLRDGRFTAYGRAQGLSNERVCAIATASDGSLWVGTLGGGVNRLVDGRVVKLAQGRLATSFVNAIYPDTDGNIWVGTNGDGLFRWRDGAWSAFTAADGLFDDVIYTILEDGRGNLWTSSNRGIARISRADLERFASGSIARIPSVSYDTADGLKEAECNGSFQPAGWRTRNGRLLFPTIKGVASIDPAAPAPAAAPPPVFVEEAIADEERLPMDGSARLPPGHDRVEFHYTALSFLAPEKLRFRYKLEGLDRDWVEAGARRTAYYTNLPAGSYRFHVQAVNADGVPNETGASFAFQQAPHFYRTPWFVALIGAALIAAAALAHRARVRAAELKAELAAARLQALKAQLQPHFLFNTLNMILPLIYRDPRSAARTLVQLGELLRQSLERDATKLVTLQDELDFLQKYLDIQRVRFQSRFTTEFSVDADVLEAAIPSLILQPLVENAIKHGISKHRGAGSIEIACGRQGDRLRVRVWNTSGLDSDRPAERSHGIGLANIEERLHLIYGSRQRFSHASVPGGFEVILDMPLTFLSRQPAPMTPAAAAEAADKAQETA